jgi:predicted RNase H-like nuclease (RuvC/YqgF family)
MKKQITLAIVLFTCLGVLSQNTSTGDIENEIKPLTEKVKTLQAENSNLKSEIRTINSRLSTINNNIAILQNQNKKNSIVISNTANQLGIKIKLTETTATKSISKLDKDITNNRLYWIIATLATLLLGGVLYWLLGKRIASSKTDVETQIRNTKKTLEEESIKLDSKLVEVLDTQLKLKHEEKLIVSTSSNTEIDHSLALKVADEIIRIHKNLQQMDANTKGLKQLSASVKRIQDNFASNGYELVEMMGKEYNEGMKVIANFIPSEDIVSGKQIITRIIKPQVNYKNEMIQSAQIEVSVGE